MTLQKSVRGNASSSTPSAVFSWYCGKCWFKASADGKSTRVPAASGGWFQLFVPHRIQSETSRGPFLQGPQNHIRKGLHDTFERLGGINNPPVF
jgi:hypothetical protein